MPVQRSTDETLSLAALKLRLNNSDGKSRPSNRQNSRLQLTLERLPEDALYSLGLHCLDHLSDKSHVVSLLLRAFQGRVTGATSRSCNYFLPTAMFLALCTKRLSQVDSPSDIQIMG